MIEKNKDLLEVVESASVKQIIKAYEKYKNKLDIFHVAFSGGKDSMVLFDLVRRTLPKKSFAVVFGDTGMEFPDTYAVIEEVKKLCEKEEILFYTAQSHFDPHDSWKLFGPPARVLRWCCSVHKSTPQTMKMREITGKNNYIGLDFVGVRKHESVARSKYEIENFSKKQKGQYSHNSILEWTSAEIWLYLFDHKLPINAAYKKGNSRAGCLCCPMGGGRGDYLQYTCYKNEVQPYLDMIRDMNQRNKGDEDALNTYISNGGWNARKNGRDLTINKSRYNIKNKNGKTIIEIIDPLTNWKEWIKILGEIPFNYEYKETATGYEISYDTSLAKKYPREIKNFKKIFRKAAYCVGCNVCVTNCRNGCISFNHGLKITNCIHCGQCLEIDDGCLNYHSLRISNGDGNMKQVSINSFANHAPKLDWVREFFESKDDFWEVNSLGKNQVPLFKRFLRDSGVLDKNNKTTKLIDIADAYGWDSNVLWGLMLCNLAYNPQINWYINNLDVGMYYERERVVEMLLAEDVSKNDTTSIITAFRRFCELPLGYVLNFGFVTEKGKQVDTLSRTKCNMIDNRVVLYSLYKFVENNNGTREFTLANLINDQIEREGVSPTLIFGLDYEEIKSILMGLSARYPDFIDATFTNDLDKITIKNKSISDVLKIFKEE